MKRASVATAVALVALPHFGCVKEVRPSGGVAGPPPNVRLFPAPAERVWPVLLSIVEIDFRLPIEAADEAERYFATKLVYENRSRSPKRYRLSGKVLPDGSGATVSLYNHREFYDGNRWRGIATDGRVEEEVLRLLEQRLSRK